MQAATAIVLLVAAFGSVAPHGLVISPLARHAYFRDQSYPQNVPMYWDSQGVWCGNAPQDPTYSTCGRCGDQSGSNDHDLGGNFGNNYVGTNWTAGAIVDVVAEFQAAHYGSFQIELCAQETETNDCFNLLPIVGGSEEVRDGNRICVPYDNGGTNIVTAQVRLPAGVRCNRCTIRWTYRTSYPGWSPYDQCYNPNPTQTFRNCANVRIN